MKKFTPILAILASVAILPGKQELRSCASHADKGHEELHLHLRSDAAGQKTKRAFAGKQAVSLLPDAGNIAQLDAADGVVARRNPFNLNGRTIRFLPVDRTSGKYRYEVAADSYDAAAAQAGSLVSGLGDDDSREVGLSFGFPFFGTEHRVLHLNSDGNVSFTQGDVAITDRSLGRMLSGPPRISALFRDLDPTRARDGVRLLNESERTVISWVQVPEFQDTGTGPLQTFQMRLYRDGRIELAFSDVRTVDAITGIAPGAMKGDPSLVTFVNGTPNSEYTSSVVERFSGSESVDIFAAAQKFYRNHEDAYDFLVIYNALGIAADTGAVAYEVTVRNQRSGYGDLKTEIGDQAGSPSRLQAILNMGPLNQYPVDPNGKVAARQSVGDTPLSTLAHEAGHLFLAYASVRDELGDLPMLGHQGAHWDFRFNSDASLMEGNRIHDSGPGVSPRFLTTATVEGFSALDQYLMGLRAPDQVPDSFFVADARGVGAAVLPKLGVAFDGERRNVNIGEIIEAEGRRTPDHTVAQRNFRFAFLVITPEGQTLTAAQLAQIEAYRTQFGPYFQRVTSQNASADSTLRRAVRVSSFPAAGVIAGSTAPVTVAIQQASPSPVTFAIRTKSGAARTPSTVTIAAGSLSASFAVSGLSEGTDDLILEPADPAYEAVSSRIQVSPASKLRLDVVSEASPVRLKVTDINDIPYAGVAVQARTAGGGSVDRSSAISDGNGVVQFGWTQPAESASQLLASINTGPSVAIDAAARPAFSAGSVVNAASYAPGLTPGGIATIFGTNMGGTNARVSIGGRTAQVLFANRDQVNFVVPADVPSGTAEILVQAGNAISSSTLVPVLTVQPGIFFDSATGLGAVIRRGEFLEVYATGLGPVRISTGSLAETALRPEVTVGGIPAEVSYSGFATGFTGLYQLNVRIPATAAPGTQSLAITSAGVRSNEVRVLVR